MYEDGCVRISESFPGPAWVPILLGGNRSGLGYLSGNGYFALWLEWWSDDAIRYGQFEIGGNIIGEVLF